MGRLIVDSRYNDDSGIGRYAREVVPLLGLAWEPLATAADPMSMLDALNPSRLRLRHDDVVYSPGFSVGPSRARQVVTVHDLLHVTHPRDDAARRHHVYYERVLKPVIRRSGHVITVSPTSARAIVDWLDDTSVEVHDCGNGCSEVFTPSGPAHESRKPYFLFVGNLKPHKNPKLALDALAATDGVDLHMVVSDIEGARRMARQAGVPGRVYVHSDINDAELASLYRGSAGLLFTSVWEGFGLPAVESMRCGKPVLYSSSCTAVAELLRYDSASIGLGPGASATDWASMMQEFAASRPTTNAPEPWLGSFTWSSVAARVSRLLVRVMGQEH